MLGWSSTALGWSASPRCSLAGLSEQVEGGGSERRSEMGWRRNAVDVRVGEEGCDREENEVVLGEQVFVTEYVGQGVCVVEYQKE